jgi:hypothetical protein
MAGGGLRKRRAFPLEQIGSSLRSGRIMARLPPPRPFSQILCAASSREGQLSRRRSCVNFYLGGDIFVKTNLCPFPAFASLRIGTLVMWRSAK